VVKAFSVFYTGGEAAALSYVQGADQAVADAENQARANNPTVHGVGVAVDDVVFTSPTEAAVRFDILINGQAIAPNQIGEAVLDGATWKLTRATACADYALGGGRC
jgi:hypothetical protein